MCFKMAADKKINMKKQEQQKKETITTKTNTPFMT